jgi:hypothetical protein
MMPPPVVIKEDGKAKADAEAVTRLPREKKKK